MRSNLSIRALRFFLNLGDHLDQRARVLDVLLNGREWEADLVNSVANSDHQNENEV